MLGKATDHRAGSYMREEERGGEERGGEGKGRGGSGGSGVAVAPIPHTSVRPPQLTHLPLRCPPSQCTGILHQGAVGVGVG